MLGHVIGKSRDVLDSSIVQVKRSNDVTKILAVSDFPGGPGVKNLPCKAEDVGSIPDWGTKIPHATEQLNV